MEWLLPPTSGLSLMFMLGLRHGLDPDHIAMIDSVAYRALDERPRLAPWMGTLFALGHGLAVTAIAVLLGAFAGQFALPAWLRVILDWLPTLLLLLVGAVNLRALFGRQVYRPQGWKTPFVPRRLRDSSHPLAIVLVGVVFALVFDTATQAAAWSYALASSGGAAAALAAGRAFTAGMVVTDTVDGRLMVRLLRQTAGRSDGDLYRRRIGWAVVAMSFAMAAYGIASHAVPAFGIGDLGFSTAGGLLLLALLLACVWAARRHPLRSRSPCRPASATQARPRC
jgi:high-affinity nickel-transport protein